MAKIRLHKKLKEIVTTQGLNYSNPEIQHNIAEYGVYVDGILEYKRLLWVQEHQGVDVHHWPRKSEVLINHVPVFFEDQDIIVFDKPAGLPVQEGTGHRVNHLTAYITHTYPEQHHIQDAGLVHRLDMNTQGLIIVAKTKENFLGLKKKFKDRDIQKTYLARVQGNIPKYDLEHFQIRSLTNPTRQEGYVYQHEAEKRSESVRACRTIFKPLVYCKELDQSLVHVEIKTGRMHQIRVAAEMLGHPLVDDPVYDSLKKKKVSKIDSKKHQVVATFSQFNNIINHISKDSTYCLISNSLIFSLSKQYHLDRFSDELKENFPGIFETL